MGARGPVPNRSEDLARDRSRKGGDQQAITRGAARPANIPDPDPNWHRIARMLWDGALDSGQADFYQSSDYAYLYSICDDLSRYKNSVKRSSMMFAALNQAFSTLLITEGDRRRVRIELQGEEDDDDEAVEAQQKEYRNGLRAV